MREDPKAMAGNKVFKRN